MPPLTPVDPDRAPPSAAVPGIYIFDRHLEREECRISLEPAAPDTSGRYEVRLLEECHDNGLRVFDPAAWHYEAGRLTLQARRGHQVAFTSEREGQGRRDRMLVRHLCCGRRGLTRHSWPGWAPIIRCPRAAIERVPASCPQVVRFAMRDCSVGAG
jgi:hypothetical protein